MTREALTILQSFNLKRPDPEVIDLIRERVMSITTQKELADELGVTPMAVNRVLNNRGRSQRILKKCVEIAFKSTDAQTSITNYLNRFKAKSQDSVTHD